MIKGKSLGIAILLVALMALMLLTACQPAATQPPVEKKVVEIGCMAGITGPGGTATQSAFWSLQDYNEYFNKEIGIPGVTLEVSWLDTRHELPLTISAYRRFVDRGMPIIVSFEHTDPFKSMCERDETPIIILPQSPFAMYPPGWLYAIFPTHPEALAVWCHWIMDNWKEDEPPRVAIMGTDNPMTHTLLEAEEYVESIGIEMLPTEFVPWAPLDATPQLLRLKENGADYVMICPLWTTAVPIVNDAYRLGLTEKMHFAGIDYAFSETLVNVLGDAAEGHSVAMFSPWWEETEIPGIKLMQDLRKEYGREFIFEGSDVHGLTIMAVTCEAVKRAIEEVGYENLNGRAVKAALDGMKDFDVYGIRKITYTPEDHRGSAAVRIYQVQSGVVIPVSEWRNAPMFAP